MIGQKRRDLKYGNLRDREVRPLKPLKHLVLDEDVHRALKKKKTETGINVKDLGNGALRSILERPLLDEAIGERIVATGLMSAVEFARLRRDALQDITATTEETSSVFQATKDNTLISGSWEMRELAHDKERGFQIFSMWARDQRFEPIPLHTHEGVEFFITLAGAIMLTVDAESNFVKAPDCRMIPYGASHSTAPLTLDTLMLVILLPPNKKMPVWME